MSGKLYLMSDIHGHFLQFLQMLKKIHFEDSDRMLILGDLVAKGPDSLGLLYYVTEHKNIITLRGNHEQRLLQYFGIDYSAEISDSIMSTWAFGDGKEIIRQMNMLSYAERKKILNFIEDMPLCAVMKIKDKKYVLVHGAPGDEINEILLSAGICGEIKDENSDIFRKLSKQLWDETNTGNELRIMTVPEAPEGKRRKTDYDILINRYASPDVCNLLPIGMTAVVGHTPTFKYGNQYAGDMIIREDKIFLDCGVAQGYGLGCLQILSENDKISYHKYFIN